MNPIHPARCDREQISSLVDGELPASQLEAALTQSTAADARECWHLYQLIGDVLRAPGLAACDRGAAVGAEVHEALQREPRRIAPPADPVRMPDVARPAANDGVFRWKMVAGLASVAALGVMGWSLVSGFGPAEPAAPQMALQQPAASNSAVARAALEFPTQTATVSETAVGPNVVMMVRDPELDRLLAAHQQSAGVSAFGNPSAFLRSATFEGQGR